MHVTCKFHETLRLLLCYYCTVTTVLIYIHVYWHWDKPSEAGKEIGREISVNWNTHGGEEVRKGIKHDGPVELLNRVSTTVITLSYELKNTVGMLGKEFVDGKY